MRTDIEIIQQTEQLAADLAALDGFRLVGSTFREHYGQRARHYWRMACRAQEVITNTDPNDAVSNVEDVPTPAPTIDTRQLLDLMRDYSDALPGPAARQAYEAVISHIHSWRDAQLKTQKELP